MKETFVRAAEWSVRCFGVVLVAFGLRALSTSPLFGGFVTVVGATFALRPVVLARLLDLGVSAIELLG